MAYTIVSSSVIILRYRPTQHLYGVDGPPKGTSGSIPKATSTSCVDSSDTGSVDSLALVDDDDPGGKVKPGCTAVKRYLGHIRPGRVVSICVVIMIMAMFGLGLVVTHGGLVHGTWYGITFTVILSLVIMAIIGLISCYEPSRIQLRFKVPFVPILPAVSNLVNIVMMFHLSPFTWLRLGIWLLVGFALYFLYGIRNSSENFPSERRTLVTSASGTVQMTTGLGDEATVTIQRQQPSQEATKP